MVFAISNIERPNVPRGSTATVRRSPAILSRAHATPPSSAASFGMFILISNVPTPRRRGRKDPAETLSKHRKDSGRDVTIFGRRHPISHRSGFVRRESCEMRSRTAQGIIEAADLFGLLPSGVPRWTQSKDAENGSKAYDGSSSFDGA